MNLADIVGVKIERTHRLNQQEFTQLHRFRLLHGFQVMANLRARTAGGGVVEPGRAGSCARLGDDLDAVAVFQPRGKRGIFVVDAGTHRAVADIGMDRVGKIDRRGTLAQRMNLAARRKHIHFIGKQINFDVLEKFQRIARTRLNFQKRLQPLMRFLLHVGKMPILGVHRFVHPVRGHTGFGDFVHANGADLQFHRRAIGAEQRRVQRLVAVGFGDRDVILEFARERFVECMQGTQRQIAGGDILDDDAKAVNIQHLGKRDALFEHFFVDRRKIFFAARHCRIDVEFFQAMIDRIENLADHFTAIAARRLDGFVEYRKTIRMQILEAEIFKLVIKAGEPEAIGNWRINFQRFPGDALLF